MTSQCVLGVIVVASLAPHLALAQPAGEKYVAVANELSIFPSVNIDGPFPREPLIMWLGDVVQLQVSYPGPLRPKGVALVDGKSGVELLAAALKQNPVAMLYDRPQFYVAVGNRGFLQVFLRATAIGNTKKLTLRFRYPDDSVKEVPLTFEVRPYAQPR